MDGHNKLPPSSSILIALASLTPPSPILSPSHLPTVVTSGDIPILFDFLSDIPTLNSIAHTVHDEDTTVFDLLSEDSLHSLDTVGTFGPTRKISLHEIDQPREIFEIAAVNTQSVIATRNESPNGLVLPIQPLVHSPATPNHPPLPLKPPNDLGCPVQQTVQSLHTCTIATNNTPTAKHSQKMAVTVASGELKSGMAGSAPLPPWMKDPKQNVLELMNNSRPQIPVSPSGPKLPVHLEWLRGTTVQLLIDQEGFRSVQARFRLSGYSKQIFAGRNEEEVQFRPIMRQVFYFHHALFDGSPVLRRIMINEEESRDYISRQASLILKANGVYTVQGSEVSPTPMFYEHYPNTQNGLRPARLSWRFDYLVGNRYDAFGNSGTRYDEGEKTLTPLTFSCSPLLFHSLQGKRVKLIHVVKKSVATKLIAEKMEPPTLPSPGTQSVDSQQPMKSRGWTHRRAKSHTPRREPKKKSPNVCNPESLYVENKTTHNPTTSSGATPIRRRRASSAGEWNREGEIQPLPLVPNVSSNYHPSKHIIPRSELAKLLDVEIINNAPILINPIIEANNFQPLTPSPRIYQRRM